MADCLNSPLRPPSSWDTAYCPHKLLLKLFQCSLGCSALGVSWGQLSNSYLCVPVHRDDASFEEDDDLSEEEKEELPPIMPARK